MLFSVQEVRTVAESQTIPSNPFVFNTTGFDSLDFASLSSWASKVFYFLVVIDYCSQFVLTSVVSSPTTDALIC